jgi:integrase/recombinase XerD
MPLLGEYGSYPIEILSRRALANYLDSLSHLAYTTHQRHQAIIQALFNFAVQQGHLSCRALAQLGASLWPRFWFRAKD